MSIVNKTSSSQHCNGEFASFGEAKIRDHHRERIAVVYVRQSTQRQVFQHQESTRLQYQLADLAEQFGWRKDRVLTIDEDLGITGRTAETRNGFQRLLTEISLNHVGLVLGTEMSRIARSNKDWHQLLELCAMFDSLLADQDGLYDPSDYNDRLLLGLKGAMSEAELHILKSRMKKGSENKARRGELITHLPVGYVRLPKFTRHMVRKLLDKWGLTEVRRLQISKEMVKLDPDEWWLIDLARKLNIDKSTMARWCRKGWVHSRKLPGRCKWWVVWADDQECHRLKQLFKCSRGRGKTCIVFKN